MADEPDTDELEGDGELDADLDDANLDEELDEEFEEDLEETEVPVADVAEVVEAEEDAESEPAPRGTKKAGDEDDDDDEVADSDDVEADLSAILKDRIAAAEDEDEEEEAETPEVRPAGETVEGVAPKRADEFTCTGCFLLVNRAQFGPVDAMECPIGEADCPAIAKIAREAKRR
jgi:hypothetical protein